MAFFRVDVPVWATVRVTADTREAALAKVHAFHMWEVGIDVSTDLGEGVELSPVATVYTKDGFSPPSTLGIGPGDLEGED
jgi:hypothetical protein